MRAYDSLMTTTAEFDPREYEDHRRELTAEELSLTQAKVQKINDRAAKRGWTGRLTVEAEQVERTEENEAGIEVTKLVYLTEITGDAPKYDGWTFLAVLDWYSAGGELITRCAPGVETGVIDRSDLREGACDHCHTVRDRKDIYLVRHEDGRTLQVGSTCLKDFMGWNTIPAWISQDDTDDMYESLSGPGRWVDFAVKDVLAAAWALIKRDGFRPASFDNATKWSVLTVLDPRSDKDREFAQEIRPLMDEAQAQADQIRAFILSDDFKGDSEYVVNLKVACHANYVTSRAFGLVVSAPQAWARAIERDLTRKAERAEIVNEWTGQVGDKLTVKATVKSLRFIDSGFGTSTLYTLVGDDNRLYKWFASRSVLGEAVTGELVTLTGTVKKLDDYQGTKSTVLTRCKVQ